MTLQEIHNAFDRFNGLRVLIIGDVMIDGYLYGKVDRISPEAPVPIISVAQRDQRLGGAANVALNVQAMGATPILASVVGDDNRADDFVALLEKEGMTATGILRDPSRPTTVKTRVISDSQHMLRVDDEVTTPLSDAMTAQLSDHIGAMIRNGEVDVIVFEDYDKGVISPELIKEVVQHASTHNLPVVVDPKKRNFLDYHGVTLFKPNLKELREGLKIDLDNSSLESLDRANAKLRERLGMEISLITLSEAGVYFNQQGESAIYPAHLRKIADVSGAGDTVVSVAALCLAAGLPASFLARLANLAGGLVCEYVGVVPIDRDRLRKEAELLAESES